MTFTGLHKVVRNNNKNNKTRLIPFHDHTVVGFENRSEMRNYEYTEIIIVS